MKFFTKMERKFGKYAIPSLTKIIIAGYVIGYLLMMFAPSVFGYLTLEPGLILRGQIWRLVTWLIIPPYSLDMLTILTLFFYYSVGTNLERAWGNFRYNVFIFGGVIFSIIGAFIAYAIAQTGMQPGSIAGVGYYFTTYYICISMYLGFAMTYPDMRVLVFFIIPMKVKWFSAVYVASIIFMFINTSWVGRIAIGASILNFAIYFLLTKNTYRYSPKEIKRRQTYKKQVQQAQPKANEPRHHCAVCGKTEKDDPDMEFRYCSKCNGTYEYCMDHLYTHEHVK